MEFKTFPFELKGSADDATFEGYASVFGNKDSYGDVLVKGAFTKTLSEGAGRVKILWQHDPYTPIGVPLFMEEDSKGLYVKGKISQTSIGRDVLVLLKDGVINELSIGYNTIQDDWDEKTSTRLLKEVKLWEFSPVTFAANEKALITSVKHMNNYLLGMKSRALSDTERALVAEQIKSLTTLVTDVEPPKSTQQGVSEVMELLNQIKNYKG